MLLSHLPFRLCVDITCKFINIEIDSKFLLSSNEFFCFGYFKNDKSRKIFQIFKSFSLNFVWAAHRSIFFNNFKYSRFYSINLSKVQKEEVIGFIKKQKKKIYLKSFLGYVTRVKTWEEMKQVIDFPNLRSIKISKFSRRETSFPINFLNTFKKLKYIYVSCLERPLDKKTRKLEFTTPIRFLKFRGLIRYKIIIKKPEFVTVLDFLKLEINEESFNNIMKMKNLRVFEVRRAIFSLSSTRMNKIQFWNIISFKRLKIFNISFPKFKDKNILFETDINLSNSVIKEIFCCGMDSIPIDLLKKFSKVDTINLLDFDSFIFQKNDSILPVVSDFIQKESKKCIEKQKLFEMILPKQNQEIILNSLEDINFEYNDLSDEIVANEEIYVKKKKKGKILLNFV